MMRKEIYPVITFIFLAIGAIVYVIHNANMPVAPHRIKINENGEEVIVLNPIEKKYIGKWYIAFEGDTPLNMMPKRKEHSRYWKLMNNGKCIYHRPDGSNKYFYWQISESDSVFSIIATDTNIPDTLRYKMYYLEENSFSTYVYSNQLRREGGHYVGWKRHGVEY